jgi:threonine/homoserine/homoserine lactone efflux protein
VAALVLLAAHAVVLLSWYPTVAYLLGRIGRAFGQLQLLRVAQRTLAVVLISLGIRLALLT